MCETRDSLYGVFSLRQGDWKYAEARGSGGFSLPRKIAAKPGEPTGQLYNMREDWMETENLYSAEPTRVKYFESLLAKVKAGTGLRGRLQ